MPVLSVVMTPNSITVRNVTDNRSEVTVDRKEVPLKIQGIFENEIRASNLRSPKFVCASRLVCLSGDNPAYLWYLEKYSAQFNPTYKSPSFDLSSIFSTDFWYKNSEKDRVSY